MANVIQLRRDTEANWISADPILAEGEIGVANDCSVLPLVKYKMGDGINNWNNLAYFNDLSDYVDDAQTYASEALNAASEALNAASSASTSATNAAASAASSAQQALLAQTNGLYLPADNLTITYNADGTVNTVSNGSITKRITYTNGVATAVTTV